MLRRDTYLKPLLASAEDDLVKILTGARGCGKTTLLRQVEAELQAAGKPTLFINFDDRAARRFRSADDLIAAVEAALTRDKLYVFLDEVSRVPDWVAVCRSLRLRNLSLFVAESTLPILAAPDISTLSGRFITFRLRPFCFREAAALARQQGRPLSLADYLLYGGLPAVVSCQNKESRLQALRDAADRMINDMICRRNLRKTELFLRLTDVVLSSHAQVVSASALHRTLKADGFSPSLATVVKLMGFLEDAGLIESMPRFDSKVRRTLLYGRKVYAANAGLVTLSREGERPDLSRLIEGAVFHELRCRGWRMSSYHRGALAVDFLAERPDGRCFIQVASSVTEDADYAREFAPFDRLDNAVAKFLITNDLVDYSTSTVKHLRLQDFLEGAPLTGRVA